MKYLLLFFIPIFAFAQADKPTETKRLLADVFDVRGDLLIVEPILNNGGSRPSVGQKVEKGKVTPNLKDIIQGLTVVKGMPDIKKIPEGVRVDVDVVVEGVTDVEIRGENRRLRLVRVVAVAAVFD